MNDNEQQKSKQEIDEQALSDVVGGISVSVGGAISYGDGIKVCSICRKSIYFWDFDAHLREVHGYKV